ncbi:hypothetical protein [Shewanella sp.]|uniref:hypothetical protein n=1 Tax=Shewanella sp. TaxID=50422 RepID=UPI0040544505
METQVIEAQMLQNKLLEEIESLEKELSSLPYEQLDSGKADSIREEISRLNAEIEEIKPNPHPSRERYNS